MPPDVNSMTEEELDAIIAQGIQSGTVDVDSMTEAQLDDIIGTHENVGSIGPPRPGEQPGFPTNPVEFGIEGFDIGKDVLSELASSSGDGMLGSTPLPGQFEMFRRLGNMILPEGLPTGEEVSQKAGETIESFSPANLAQIPGMLATPTGRKNMAVGAAGGLDVGKRIEEGDLLGLLADVATTKPGMSALKAGTSKALRTTNMGGKIIDKATDVSQRVKNLGSAIYEAPLDMSKGFMRWANSKAGVGAKAKDQLRAVMENPNQYDIYREVKSTPRDGYDPELLATHTKGLLEDQISDMTTNFGSGLDDITLQKTIPNAPELIEAVRSDLEKLGVRINPVTKEITYENVRPTKQGAEITKGVSTTRPGARVEGAPTFTEQSVTSSPAEIAIRRRASELGEPIPETITRPGTTRTTQLQTGNEQTQLPDVQQTKQVGTGEFEQSQAGATSRTARIKTGEEAQFGDFDNANISGDTNAVNAIIDNMFKLSKKTNPSFKDLREILGNLGRLQKNKEYLGSDFKDLVLGRATGRVRDAIVEAAEVYKIPEAIALRKLNKEYATRIKDIKRVSELFNIKKGTKPETLVTTMLRAYDSPYFTTNSLEILESIDDGVIIPSLLGLKAKEFIPPGLKSEFLGATQAAGAVKGIVAGVAGAGATYMFPPAVLAVPYAMSFSPGFALKMTEMLGKAKGQWLVSKLNNLKDAIPPALASQVTIGALLGRAEERGDSLGGMPGIPDQAPFPEPTITNPTVLDSLPVQ
jgi:hypothetical protein